MRLGHLALSQTVSSRSSSKSEAVKWFALPNGTLRFSQRGNRRGSSGETIGKAPPAAELRSSALALRLSNTGNGCMAGRVRMRKQGTPRIDMIAFAAEGRGHAPHDRL